MELKQFVAETLKQIVQGVKDAQVAVHNLEGEVNPVMQFVRDSADFHKKHPMDPYNRMYQVVEFDVAVTAVEGEKAQLGGGILVGWFGLGAKDESSTLSQSMSRIKFSIPMTLPVYKPPI